MGDEGALKNSLSFKGAAGSIPCFFCWNICQHGSELATFDTSGFLVPRTDLNKKQWHLHTQQSILEVIDLLKNQKSVLGKGAFEKLEQSLGIAYQTDGALFCEQFHVNFEPIDNRITRISNQAITKPLEKPFDNQITWTCNHFHLKAIDPQTVWISLSKQLIVKPTGNRAVDSHIRCSSNDLTTKSIESQIN